MPKKKNKNEDVVNIEATFKMKVIIRNDTSIKELLEKETEFIAEPQSVNGCVFSMDLKNIKKN